jgi:hypothetical protein
LTLHLVAGLFQARPRLQHQKIEANAFAPSQQAMNKMNAAAFTPRRGGGMQVHAVPESERAIDANGQRLPWAYEYAE